MQRLPGFMQPFLTWLTGMPLSNEIPVFLWTPNRLIFANIIKILSGIGIGIWGMGESILLAIPLILISWILTTGGMRMFYVVIEHSCTHNNCGDSPEANRIIGELISATLWTTTFEDFKKAHIVHHHATRKERDPDAQFLIQNGFTPNMQSKDFYNRLIRVLLSPAFHITYIRDRVRSNLSSDWKRTILWITITSLILLLVGITNTWAKWFVLWLIPATILFHCSSLINYLSI